MRTMLFSVRDMKAEAYLEPFHSMTVATAIRSFQQASTDPEHQFCKWPEDYHLYLVGEFDLQTGDLKLIDRTCVSRADDFQVPTEPLGDVQKPSLS